MVLFKIGHFIYKNANLRKFSGGGAVYYSKSRGSFWSINMLFTFHHKASFLIVTSIFKFDLAFGFGPRLGWEDVLNKDLNEMGTSWEGVKREALNRLGWRRSLLSCGELVLVVWLLISVLCVRLHFPV